MAQDILEIIAAATRERVAQSKAVLPIENMKVLAQESQSGGGKFYNALQKDGVSFICEIKKASPSKGIIDAEFDYMKILSDYEKGGADALSVLTEPQFFLGGNHIFNDIRNMTALPMLRKDFIVDEYQIYETKALGADAMLIICAMLERKEIEHFYSVATNLGLDILVETHNEEEMQLAIDIGADIIGVNSRNLKNFDVSLSGGLQLIKDTNCGKDLKQTTSGRERLFVAESGIVTQSDIADAFESGASAALIGETLMRSHDRVNLLQSFKKVGESI